MEDSEAAKPPDFLIPMVPSQAISSSPVVVASDTLQLQKQSSSLSPVKVIDPDIGTFSETVATVSSQHASKTVPAAGESGSRIASSSPATELMKEGLQICLAAMKVSESKLVLADSDKISEEIFQLSSPVVAAENSKTKAPAEVTATEEGIVFQKSISAIGNGNGLVAEATGDVSARGSPDSPHGQDLDVASNPQKTSSTHSDMVNVNACPKTPILGAWSKKPNLQGLTTHQTIQSFP